MLTAPEDDIMQRTNISSNNQSVCNFQCGGYYKCSIVIMNFEQQTSNYSFRVAAQNCKGVGPFSESINVNFSHGKF